MQAKSIGKSGLCTRHKARHIKVLTTLYGPIAAADSFVPEKISTTSHLKATAICLLHGATPGCSIGHKYRYKKSRKT